LPPFAQGGRMSASWAMSEADDPAADRGPDLEVCVTRTGGFAGLRREWLAKPPEQEAPQWIELIDRCPWPDQQGAIESSPAVLHAPSPPAPAQPGADRFVWLIRARSPRAGERSAELAENDVTDAWEELIAAVRDYLRAAPR
jgi:hypothetical protein